MAHCCAPAFFLIPRTSSCPLLWFNRFLLFRSKRILRSNNPGTYTLIVNRHGHGATCITVCYRIPWTISSRPMLPANHQHEDKHHDGQQPGCNRPENVLITEDDVRSLIALLLVSLHPHFYRRRFAAHCNSASSFLKSPELCRICLAASRSRSTCSGSRWNEVGSCLK